MQTGFYPFWFWNGEMDETEIRRQIREMADHGIKGFYIHPRQGLTVPYLSDAFFARVGAAIEEASQHGLTVHLYDEYPYPSGVAGGEVPASNPEFAATRLVPVVRDVASGPCRLEFPRGAVLRCVAYPIGPDGTPVWTEEFELNNSVGMVLARPSYNETGLTTYNRKRFFASGPTPVLETVLPDTHARWRVCTAILQVVDDHKYWGSFIDCLNPDAVAAFIEATHERYRSRFGDFFGTVVPSIFTDETEPRWSRLIAPRYASEYGRDLIGELPALLQTDHPGHASVVRDFERLRHRMFCEAFEQPIASWCRKNGIMYCGEKPAYRVSQLAYMDIPGCEPGHTKAGRKTDALRAPTRANARAVASAAYVYGKDGALCECYHSMGWGATMQDARLIADTLLLFGIDHLVPHGFFYSTHGLRKHDAPPSFFFQMPYWPLWHHVSDRIDRIAAAFESTRIDAEIAVIDPNPYQPSAEDSTEYERLMEELVAMHRGFVTVDFDVLADRPAAELAVGSVLIRDRECRAVVMPPVGLLDDDVAEWLERFEAGGGTVIRGTPGTATDLGEIENHVPRTVPIRLLEGERERVYSVSRSGDARRVFFVVNTGRGTARVVFETRDTLSEIPLDPEAEPLLSRSAAGYERELAPFESVLVRVGADEAGTHSISAGRRPGFVVETVPVGTPTNMRLLAANLARLGNWELQIADEAGRFGAAVPVTAAPLENQIAASGIAFSPEFGFRFGLPPTVSVRSLTVRYSCEFECSYAGPVMLVVEPDSIVGEWALAVNGTAGPDAADLVPVGPEVYPVRGALGVEITNLIRAGRNTIVITVTADGSGGLVNPIYLSGDFGVDTTPLTLRAPTAAAVFDDVDEAGAPYYAGVIEYTFEWDRVTNAVAAPDSAEVAFGAGFEDACEISFNGGPFHPALWSPYRVYPKPGELRHGRNTMVVRVYTSLIRAFEGTRFVPDRHEYVSIGGTMRKTRKTSVLAPDWWDFTTLDQKLLDDAAALTERDLLQLSRDGFTVVFYETLEEFYLAEALEYIDAWRASTPDKPVGVCGPIGPTEQLPLVARLVNALGINLAKHDAHFWGMDEWVLDGKPVDRSHPLSFRKANEALCFGRMDPALQMPEANKHYPLDTASFTASFDQIRCAVMQGGQGDVKHWAFNDPLKREGAYRDAPPSPEEYRKLGARMVELHPITIMQNARTSGGGRVSEVPTKAMTVGPVETWKSDKVSIWHAGTHDNPFGMRLTAFMISKGIADSAVPMSLLADHPNVQFNYYRPAIKSCNVEMH